MGREVSGGGRFALLAMGCFRGWLFEWMRKVWLVLLFFKWLQSARFVELIPCCLFPRRCCYTWIDLSDSAPLKIMELGCAVVPIKEINLVLKTPVLLRRAELDWKIYLSARQNSPGDTCSWWTSLDVPFPFWGRFAVISEVTFPWVVSGCCFC